MAVADVCAAELRYAQTMAAVDLVARDEEQRQLRLRNIVLSHDLQDANEKLLDESERADQAEQQADYWEDIAKDNEQKLEQQDAFANSKSRELDRLRAELSSLQTVSCDSANLLTEKLALSRELANLRPELEHLRSQVAANENLFAEKLELKREVSTYQSELDDVKRQLHKLESQEGKTTASNASHRNQIHDLEKELANERRERQKAEKVAEAAGNDEINDLQRQVTKEKRAREKAEKALAKPAEVENEVADLKAELATERLERQKLERNLAKSESEWEAQKAILDDKLDQFRTKLRSTKESLKEAKLELQQAKEAAPAALDVAPANIITTDSFQKPPKNARKRNAQQMDPHATFGTPGDAPQNKRSRRATSLVGEKSTFSITPFLNRTSSIALETEEAEVAQPDDDLAPSVEAVESPSAHKTNPAQAPTTTKVTATKKIPLAPASPGKSNLKVKTSSTRKKAAARAILEKVTEEEVDDDDDNTRNSNPSETASTVAVSTTSTHQPIKPARLSLKPKSLNSFATFREGSLPPQQLQKKKRKLGGSGAKTIFDEEDDNGEAEIADLDDEGATKTSLFGAKRAFGALGSKPKLLGGKGLGLLGGVKKKGPLVVANDGFMFSPLKKDRKNMTAAMQV